MDEKKRYRPSKLFLQWSFSYLLISVIALLLILALGYRYTDVLRDNLEYTNAMQLDSAKVWLDQKLNLLRNITSKESFSDSIAEIQSAASYDTVSRYSYYLLSKEVASDVLNYGIEDTYFLYFPSVDAMVMGGYYGQSERFYELHLKAYGIAYEDWMETINRNYSTTQVFEPKTQDAGEQKYMILIRPLNINNVHEIKVNAVLMLDLEDLASTTDWVAQKLLCIVDRNMDKLVLDSTLPENVVPYLEARYKDDEAQKLKEAQHIVDEGKYISMVSSDYENWDIAVIVEERIFLSKLVDVQKLIVIIVLVYLVLSSVVIITSARRHYGKLKNVMDALVKDNSDVSVHIGDAYAYIDTSVQRLIRANIGRADIIEQQHNVILRELLNTMLTSPNASAEVSSKMLRENGFPLQAGQSYYLLAYKLDMSSVEAEKDPSNVLEMEWFILQNVTEENLQSRGLKDLCFRKGKKQLYVIWAQDNQAASAMRENIRWAYQFCKDFLSQHFDFRYAVAVSREQVGIDGLYKANTEIRRIYQYQKKLGKTEAVFYEEIDFLPDETSFQYPMETENRLRMAVHSADEAAACEQIRSLIDLNRAVYLSTDTVQFMATKLIADIVREVEVTAEDKELTEAKNRVSEAARSEELDNLEQTLCALVRDVCARQRSMKEREQADEKKRLYLEIRDYIGAQYFDPGLNVNSVAEHFEKPAPFVSRYFKEMHGENLTQYIHRVRLAYVKEKLLRDEKLEDIAVSCGFGSQRSFLRIFKQYEGVTPSQYKELHSSGNEAKDENL